MKIGVAYYPEHWPEDRWPEDARLMRQAGIDVVRLGEFAWSRLEPRRGQYDMDWLGRAMDVLAEQGLKVILCTPTATPPTWLFNRHPTMFPQDREGKPWYMGSRRHACLNNRPYRRYVRRIVREMVKTLGNRPEVCAWQVDNEIGCHGSGHLLGCGPAAIPGPWIAALVVGAPLALGIVHALLRHGAGVGGPNRILSAHSNPSNGSNCGALLRMRSSLARVPA